MVATFAFLSRDQRGELLKNRGENFWRIEGKTFGEWRGKLLENRGENF